MDELTPTRSLAIALAEERRTMREGHAFLDEKCLLLAGEMLRAVRLWQQRQQALRAAWRDLQSTLRAAVAHHGLHGLQLYPALPLEAPIDCRRRVLLGVTLQSAELSAGAAPPPAPPAVAPSPQATACRRAFAAALPALAELAALSGDLARLHAEYKRTVRRARALQDVLLPEIDRTLSEVETALEELEQDEAAVLRQIARRVGGPAPATG